MFQLTENGLSPFYCRGSFILAHPLARAARNRGLCSKMVPTRKVRSSRSSGYAISDAPATMEVSRTTPRHGGINKGAGPDEELDKWIMAQGQSRIMLCSLKSLSNFRSNWPSLHME